MSWTEWRNLKKQFGKDWRKVQKLAKQSTAYMQNAKNCFRQQLAGIYLESYNIMKSKHNLAMQ